MSYNLFISCNRLIKYNRVFSILEIETMHRVHVIAGHFSNSPTSSFSTKTNNDCISFQATRANASDSPDDVVIVSAKRTPIGKAKRGFFKDTSSDDLLTALFTGLLKDVNLNPTSIGDICVGNVNDSTILLAVRAAQFRCGIPETVPATACNRYCSSGLQAVMNIAGSIKAGVCDIGIGAGIEMMSHETLDVALKLKNINPQTWADFPKARDCLIPMGITSENVAERFGISREKQDSFAVISHQKAAKAYQMGYSKDEIIPVTVNVIDKNGINITLTVDKDEGFRPETNMTVLAKLKPAFKEGGSTTAGNSSQVSDGAAGVVLARRSVAGRMNFPILGVIRAYAVVGVPPDIMGIGPAFAIPEALHKAGLTIQDIDIFEINEAFASQAVYCVEKLGIPIEKVNPRGGAVAIGHPLGCTGSRQIATLLHEFKQRRKRAYGVISMCVGTGMGAAAVIEYPGPQ